MIRQATDSDCEDIAKSLWKIRAHFKAQQIATSLWKFNSPEAISLDISQNLTRWLVCDSPDGSQAGFFSFVQVGKDRVYKRWGFPEQFVHIEHYNCLLSGDKLVEQFRAFITHFKDQSIMIRIESPLRGVLWAAVKSGFQFLGECPLIVGTDAWLYVDRDNRFETIQAKLKKAKIVTS